MENAQLFYLSNNIRKHWTTNDYGNVFVGVISPEYVINKSKYHISYI